MASSTASVPALGRFLRNEGEYAVFSPLNTNYELHLKGSYSGPLNTRTSIVIRATGRKLLTVPSGGNFVSPIFGTPKTFQGRVRAIEGNQIHLHAGVPAIITLPEAEHGIDLNNGSITVGQMINVIVLPGATFEVVS